MADTRDELLEAWHTNNRINLYLIEHVGDEGWRSTLSTRGGRDVGRQFAHLHDNRVWHLEKRARELAEGLETFASKETPPKEAVVSALEASGEAIATFLVDLLDGREDRKGFRKGLFTTLAYFVAHESHHRGNIVLTLKQSGHPVPRDVRGKIWDWDRR